MKKIFILLLGGFFLALTTQAQDLTIMKFADGMAPTIDGTVDAIWDLIEEEPIELDDPDDFGPTSVYDCFFKMAWNDTALFLLMHRSDDDFSDQWDYSNGLADWQVDRDEIFLDVNVDTLDDGRGASDAQVGGTGADFGHYQFTSIWIQDADQWSGNPNQWYHNAPFQFGYNFVNEDEYFTEYCFPFESLTINTAKLPSADATFQGGEDVVFGLLITIADVDMSDSPTDENFRKFMRWEKDQGGWGSMDTSGHVLMSGTTISGIEQSTLENGAYAYPSPAANSISLGNLDRAATVVIYDVVGNQIMRINHVENNEPMDISALRSGTYFIKVNDEETIKFIKQ